MNQNIAIKTTATNRKIRILLTAIKNGALVPRPEFQRRLVWTNKHKLAFLDTVLKGFPFPEIYIAAGQVDPDTGEGTEMLVDGQQRITTLNQYFTGSKELTLSRDTPSYADLTPEVKIAFLEYEVVVRDLGQVGIDTIKEVFKRINSTRYSLNAMEVQNSRFDGEMKLFAEKIAANEFFENNHVFSATDVRRMGDTRYALTIIVTLMSSYFHRDDELESFLANYNDEFERKEELEKEISEVFKFVDSCKFEDNSRVWKKADLLTLLVESHRLLCKKKSALNPDKVKETLSDFYAEIDNLDPANPSSHNASEYHKFSIQATNDRTSRIKRGEIIGALLEKSLGRKKNDK
jgi:hypothetical protein